MSLLFKKLLALRHTDYITLDQDFVVVEASATAALFIDPFQDLAPGEDCRSLFPELFGAEEQLTAVLENQQQSFELKSIYRFSDQGSIYFDLCVTKLDEPEIAKGALIVFLEDVTQQSILEQRLAQSSNEANLLLSALTLSKSHLDEIIASMTDVLVVTDKFGIIKSTNLALEALLGYTEAELVGQPFGKLVAEDDFLFQILQPDASSSETTLKDVEIVCQTKTGEKLSIAFSGASILTEVKGIQGFLYTGRDITDRQRSQQRLMLQYSAARILSEAETLVEAVSKLLPAVCQNLDWDVTNLWLVQDEDLLNKLQPHLLLDSWTTTSGTSSSTLYLKCVEGWSKPIANLREFVEAVRSLSLAQGVGFAGQVWAAQSPLWVQDVTEAPDFSGVDHIVSAGLHGAFGFPIRSNREILGVITFFSRLVKQPDPALLKTMTIIGSQLGQFIKRKQTEAALREQQHQSERLLLNVLPKTIVDRLKQSKGTIAEHFDSATVLFADLVGFTEIAACLSPINLVALLNQIFSAFDRLTEQFNLEKIKTVGDAYMVVGGVPQKRLDHAQAIAEMALAMQTELAFLNRTHHQSLKMRIGIHSGPVIAGVIGIKKFTYDLWGDTVNTASRMESHGLAEQIQVTESTYQLLQHQYSFQNRGPLTIKGKGEMTTYLLTGRKSAEVER